ncbi:MAG: phosphate ABC transporter substrate-binding protein PstS [Actinomycetota bacterium]|nr:phosphate ABC transporter substrate-binding protein PstS [Rubrobacter sp.]MDQ3508625.1 phosphate ABC transporter substrate-binding protein PstS [Actinomycetota bacterium]
MRKFARWKMLGAGLALSVMLAGCTQAGESEPGEGGGGEGEEASGDVEMAQSIDGAGATFPAPLYNEMFQTLAEDDGIQVNYQSVGSGSGIEQYISGTVDFGASDAPMTEEELGQVEEETLHVATVGGPVVPTYNLPGVDELNLTGELLGEIFLGNVTEWNDPAIAELNPDADLPEAQIQVVHRSDGSGTTSIWTEYLAVVSEQWASDVGAGTDVAWPVGAGGDGNEGVAAQVQQTENSIGYNELGYATENDIPYANVGDTPEGPFVEATEETAGAAIAGADVPDDLRISISAENITEGPDGEEAFPITGLTWLLIRQEQDDLAVCKAVAEAAWFATHEGQEFAPPNYVPIGGGTLETSEEFIQSMEAQGQPCYEGGGEG